MKTVENESGTSTADVLCYFTEADVEAEGGFTAQAEYAGSVIASRVGYHETGIQVDLRDAANAWIAEHSGLDLPSGPTFIEAEIVWVHDPHDDPRVRCLHDDEDEADASRDHISDPSTLQRRRTTGEHICLFCVHAQVCGVTDVLRRFEALVPIVSGCAGWRSVNS